MGSEPSSESSGVQAACDQLRRVFLDEPEVQLVLFELNRRHGILNGHFLERQHRFWIGVGSLPNDVAAMLARDAWAKDIAGFLSKLDACGQSLSRLAQTTGDGWRCVARFLEQGDPSCWSYDDGQRTGHGAGDARLLKDVQSTDILVRKIARSLFLKRVEYEIPLAPPPARLHEHLRTVLAQCDWSSEVPTMRRSLHVTLGALRTAAASRITVNGGYFAWFAPCLFLGVWYNKHQQNRAMENQLWRLNSIAAEWLPELSGTSETQSSTGQDEFDISNACDPENRVFTSVGTTRTPGSRRDNRGHN